MTIAHPSHSVRTWVEIDRDAICANYERFRKLARGAAVMAVVKSNAYGHGLSLVAKILAGTASFKRNGWFGVDSIVEALRLRRDGTTGPILVLGHTLSGRYADAVRSGVVLTVSNFEALAALGRAGRRPEFHVKLDTGMHRQGFQAGELDKLASALGRFGLRPQGVYSHFAWEENAAFSRRQMASFEKCLDGLAACGVSPRVRHISRTGTVGRYEAANYDIVRVGLGLYGYAPYSKSCLGQLRPVMSWKTVIAELKSVRKGEGIGYDLTERVGRDSAVAILPIGYWHGYDRGLSSSGEVLARGRRCKVLGLVCMDMTAIDVTGVPGVRVGDEVVIIGRQGREYIDADEVAGKIGTTSYEVLTRINPLVRRIIV